jgi:DHA2 family multidrug resistance protein-like MFS transporter
LAIGVAILGSIGTAVYRRSLDDSLPAGIPAADATTARDTLGGALEVASALPGQTGFDLAEAARQAFTQGLQVNVLLAAALTAGAALLPVLLLRHVRPASETVEEPDTPLAAGKSAAGLEPASSPVFE